MCYFTYKKLYIGQVVEILVISNKHGSDFVRKSLMIAIRL